MGMQRTTEKPLIVSGDIDRPQYAFSSALDEVAAFNRVLSQAEIKGGIDKILAVEVTGLFGPHLRTN